MKPQKDNKNFDLKVIADKAVFAADKQCERVIEIALITPEKKTNVERAPLNLSLVIDRSGSMDGEKLDFVKQAAVHVVELLDKKDRVAVVIYDDTVDVILPSTFMTNEAKEQARQKISAICSGGSTFLFGGWVKGCEQVAEATTAKTFNRTMLLTDGLANVGVTSHEELAGQARQVFRRGVATSCFGVGNGYDEHLLEAMANNGGGNFHFLETINAIPLVFEREFLELINLSLRDTEISLDLPDTFKVSASAGYQLEKVDGMVRAKIGSLVAGRTQYVYLKLKFPKNLPMTEVQVPIRVYGRDEDDREVRAEQTIVFKKVDASQADAIPADKTLMERFALVDLADQATEALKRERAGDRHGASQMMTNSLAQHQSYLPSESSVKYAYMSTQFMTGLDENARKRYHAQQYSNKRGRSLVSDYRLRLVKGMLVAEIDGRTVVVNTSVQNSTGIGSEWYFMDEIHQFSQDAKELTPDKLSKHLGISVDVILGMDILKKYYVTVDLPHQRISFGIDPASYQTYLRHFSHQRIRLENRSGNPAIHCTVMNEQFFVNIDTTAALNYVDKDLGQSLTSIGMSNEFLFDYGVFKTSVFLLPVKLANQEMEQRFGTLPGKAEFKKTGPERPAILGTEIFGKFVVCLAFPNKELILFSQK